MRQARVVLAVITPLLVLSACTASAELPVADPTNSTAVEGRALVESKCSRCHTLQRVIAKSADRGTWTATVSRMQGNGLVVTPEEKLTIIEYLSTKDAN